ncbi:MAG: TadE family protein [Cypionkella sp.]
MVEFALLAPIFIALLFGAVAVGIYMQNINAVRSLATDATRFAAVEYQRNNRIAPSVIQANIEARAVSTPYMLNPELLTVSVTEVSPSRVNGARELSMTISYALPSFIGGTRIDAFTYSQTRPIFVIT